MSTTSRRSTRMPMAIRDDAEREKAFALKKTRAGHLAYLSKLYRHVEVLMISLDNRDQVVRVSSDIDIAYNVFVSSNTTYVNSLNPMDSDELAGSDVMRTAQAEGHKEFTERLKDWLEREDLPEELPVGELDMDRHSVKSLSRCSSRASSGSSTRLREAKAREAVARLKIEQIEQRQKIEREAGELKMKREILDAENEVQIASLERTIWQEEVTLDERLPSEHLPPSSPRGSMKHPLDPKAHVYVPNSNTGVADIKYLLDQHKEAYSEMASEVRRGFGMPKPELLTFDGDPTKYWKFVNNFEANIHSGVSDERVRLSYLIQHCIGEARYSIKDCVILEPQQGYQKAREILHQRYGRSHIIARAYIGQLTNGMTLKSSDQSALRKLSLEMNRCELTLTHMGYCADMNNSENLLKIVRRFPMHMRTKWADKADRIIESGWEPKFSDLAKFVEIRSRVASNMYGQDLCQPQERVSSFKQDKPTGNYSKVTTLVTQTNKREEDIGSNEQRKGRTCPACSKEHDLYNCETFKAKTFEDRRKLLRLRKLCDNCFKYGHIARSCLSNSVCNVCHKKHHTLLHLPRKPDQGNVDSKNFGTATDDRKKITDSSKGSLCATTGAGNDRICLKIVPVKIAAKGLDRVVYTYALLDDCSDVSLCEQGLIDELGACGRKREFSLTTVNGENSYRQGVEVELKVSSVDGADAVNLKRVWTVDRLPISNRSIPRNNDITRWKHLNGIEFPRIEDTKIGLLIGSDVPEVFWALEDRRGERGEPYAVRSLLGWTLIGPLGNVKGSRNFNVNYIGHEDDLLQTQLERFWKTDFNDSLSEGQVSLSQEDKRALNIVEKSVKFVDGHFQVALPWRREPPLLENNRPLAEARLRMLKRRFRRNEELFGLYKITVNKYLHHGYAEKVERSLDHHAATRPLWYLPHHPVIHPKKPGKVRVVFDCAAKYRGTSLNDQLLQGPNLTNSLVGVLIRFREEPIALMADIEAMFHQVRVDPRDCDVFRFLWWPEDDMEREPEDYRMRVHPFGATSSPCCASFSLRKVAEANADNFGPEVIRTVHRNFYVDDCLKSVKTEEAAEQLAHDLRNLLAKGGFHLTKWMSNSRSVLASLPGKERASTEISLDLDDLPVERALGVSWDVQADQFKFGTLKGDKPTTRRGILSAVSSLYDPLGFVAPVILPAKRLLQGLCTLKLGWDDELDVSVSELWKKWLDDLPKLSDICIDRCYKPEGFGDIELTQLHHFADASMTGYGAVSYLRFVDVDGHIHCSFILGKSRLAPLKIVTIPRLELTAAVVAVKLDRAVKSELDLQIDETIFWTDSMSVLQYIENESRRFHTFVANRLETIHEVSSPSQWRHVDTKSNPADYASRGLRSDQVLEINRWLKGPEFLWKDETQWPVRPGRTRELGNDDPEVRKEGKFSFVVQACPLKDFILHYSSWYRLKKGIAWLLRYKAYCCHVYLKKDTTPAMGDLTVKELQDAATQAVRYVQHEEFPKETSTLSDAKVTSHIRKLSPMMVDDILRVGGRLQRAPVLDAIKHPIIIPSKHHITDLIIRHHHTLSGHCGPEYVLSSVRQKFWVVKGRSTVRRVLRSCFECRKRNATRGEQFMAPLPAERVTPDKPPFTYVGVDYFGPLNVKQGRSTAKRYGCLFTCLTTRAIHIEIAHSLDTDSFINALRRFVSRRGTPEKLFSDNGTNFKGGDRELKEALRSWNRQKIKEFSRQSDIIWQFNPPAASHMGGVWERMIRSVRRILKAVLKEQIVNDEGLLTFMSEVERIMNDRPLTLSGDVPEDQEPLSPSKLLLLRSNPSLPPGLFKKEDQYCKRRWRQIQYLADVFWRRWMREYLPLLQLRQKWIQKRRNFAVNDIVLAVHDNSPRGQWPLGRVVETFADKDGFVRSVKIRTATSYYVRPIAKLCLLEGDVNDSSSPERKIEVDDRSSHQVADQDPIVSRSEVEDITGQSVNMARRSTRTSRTPGHLQDYNRN